MSNLDDVLIPNDQGRILKFRYVRTTFGCLIARSKRYQSNSSILGIKRQVSQNQISWTFSKAWTFHKINIIKVSFRHLTFSPLWLSSTDRSAQIFLISVISLKLSCFSHLDLYFINILNKWMREVYNIQFKIGVSYFLFLFLNPYLHVLFLVSGTGNYHSYLLKRVE